MTEEPSNAVLAERIAEVKEDIRELTNYVRHNIERIDGALAGSLQKRADLDVKVQQEHDATVALRTIVDYDRATHAKVHSDDTSRTRFVLTIMCAAIAAAAAMGLLGLAVR